MRLAAAGFVLGVASLTCVTRADGESGWHTIHQADGITVSTRDVPGEDMPVFRGQAALQGSVLHLLAILVDDSRSKEWAKGVDEGYVLRTLNERAWIVYSRSRQTWPVADRDLVMKRTVEVLAAGASYRVRLVCVPGEKPVRPGVIRVTECETSFLLRKIDATHTAVDYNVRAHPGGHTPAWIARLASKNIPLDTLTALAKQVDRTRGKYDAEIKHWADNK